MLASHNSFSFLKPLHWYDRITIPWSKCQNLTIEQQLLDGVRLFDLRIAFEGDKIYVVHNHIKYALYEDIKKYLDFLQDCVLKGNEIYIRIGLDMRKKPKNETEVVQKFMIFLEEFKQTYFRLKIAGAITFWNWDYIISSPIEIIEKHFSVQPRTLKETILGIKHYAFKHNPYFKKEHYYDLHNHWNKALMLDYTQVYMAH